MLIAIGTTPEELRLDYRYKKATGNEKIVVRQSKNGWWHIIEAPPWLVAQDFGPFGVRQAKRAGWLP